MEEKSFVVKFLGQPITAHYIKETERAKKALSVLSKYDGLFGLDTETKARDEYVSNSQAALSPHLGQIRLLQIYNGTQSYLFDWNYLDKEMFREFLETKKFIAHNAKFDLGMLKSAGFYKINIGCTLIGCRLLSHAKFATDSKISSLSLGAVVKMFFKEDILKVLQKSDWGKPDLTFEQIEYAALDAVCVSKIADLLAPALKAKKLLKVYSLYKDAQHPIVDMELRGIDFDIDAHKNLQETWRHKMIRARKSVLDFTGLEEITGHKISKWLTENLSSHILAEWPKTATGKLSTARDTFQEFANLRIVEPFLQFQKYETLLSTFGSKLVSNICPATDRLHPRYNIAGARTGRLSSSGPNIQNQPRDKDIRNLYFAPPGYLLIVGDFVQIEVQVAAQISGDTVMKYIYERGADIYIETAARVLGIKPEDVTPLERQKMKAVVLGRLFGLGAEKFVKYAKVNYGVDVDHEEASEFIENFKATYPQFTQWQYQQGKRCSNSLKATTAYGKLRALDENFAYTAGLNHPIQGTAAEIILGSINNLSTTISAVGELFECVHDEIGICVREDMIEEGKFLLSEAMESSFYSVFPNANSKNLIEIGVGSKWGECK